MYKYLKFTHVQYCNSYKLVGVKYSYINMNCFVKVKNLQFLIIYHFQKYIDK